ncbi:MAG TPA: hypothetical protein DGJ56_09975 [Verrucomicrobiales bacterium]|nr:hypothetical protein [Verrucomicrobiales bacterium]
MPEGLGFSGVVGRLMASNMRDTTRIAISQRMVEGCQVMSYLYEFYAPDFLRKKKKGPHLWAVLKFLVYFII